MKKVTEQLKNVGLKNAYTNNLKESYFEALKDPSFKLLVSKLKLSEETLMKYTSMLEDCSKDYDRCLKCKGLLECSNKLTGYAYMPKASDDKLEFNYIACRFQKKFIKDTSYLNNIYLFDVPKEIKEARMKDIFKDDDNRIDAILWLNNFIKNYDKEKKQKGLYLYGNFGCGKTYMIAAMFNELAKKGVKSAIVFWPEYLRDLKSSFQTDFKQKFEYIKKVPLLLIDDIGAESTTEWGRDEIFCPIIQYRMQEQLPTFFTSNLDLKSLEVHFSITKDRVSDIKAKRIIERIEQLTEVQKMISKNLRK
jgi:primosomal protein DnaI